MALTYYLIVDGIDGGHDEPGLRGAFVLEDFSYEIVAPVIGGSGGAGAGRPQPSLLETRLHLPGSLTDLAELVAGGRHLAAGVRIVGLHQDSRRNPDEPAYEMTLGPVIVSRLEERSDGLDLLAFDGGAVEVITREKDMTGRVIRESSAVYDFAAEREDGPPLTPTPDTAPVGPIEGTSYLLMEGITGPEQLGSLRGAFEIDAYTFGVSNSATTQLGAGAGSGKVSFDEITVDLDFLVGLPELLSLATTGRFIDLVQIVTIAQTEAGPRRVHDLRLENVGVSLLSQRSDAPDRVGFTFQEIEIETVTLAEDFTPIATDSFGWSAVGNAPGNGVAPIWTDRGGGPSEGPINGTAQSEVLSGTVLADTMNGYAGRDSMSGGAGADMIFGWTWSDLIEGGNDDDTMRGGAGRDTLLGGAGNDQGDGNSGADLIAGGTGNDTLSGNAGRDTIDGDGGDDLITGGRRADLLRGGTGNDTLAGNAGRDTVDGGDGDDAITGGRAGDLLRGGAGNDTLDGQHGDDLIEGGSENDTLSGGDGHDSLFGGAGGDRLDGDAGSDLLNGEDGRDTLSGGLGDDSLLGGAQNDSAAGGRGDDAISGGTGDDTLRGDAGRDALQGDAGDDAIFGGDGTDRLFGSAGDDTLDGGAGADTLTGGSGNDRLTGGMQADVFAFFEGAGQDTIVDFRTGLDVIALDGLSDLSEVGFAPSETGADTVLSWRDVTVLVLGVTAAEMESDVNFL